MPQISAPIDNVTVNATLNSEAISQPIKHKNESLLAGIVQTASSNLENREGINKALDRNFSCDSPCSPSKITDLIQKSEVFSPIAQSKSLMNIERAACDLETYCKITNPGSLTLNESISLIKRGRDLYNRITKTDCTASTDPAESQEELASLSWFLMDLAIKKGQGYTQGAFMIEDPNQKLYQFLVSSPGYACGIRKSSHFKGRCPNDNSTFSYFVKSSSQHGVDVINEKLPADKRTILFEMVENAPFLKDVMPSSVLFFKLENFSPFLTTAHGYDAFHHTFEWGMSVYNKKMFPGSDDLPTMRKERIPSDMLKDFGKVIYFIQENPSEFEQNAFQPASDEERQLLDLGQARKNSELWGIAYMYHFLENVKTMPVADASKAKLHELIDNLLNKITLLDNCDRRTGREVYLTTEELQKD